jgi:uncharacterized membrane protein YoaT (DUF817 family)
MLLWRLQRLIFESFRNIPLHLSIANAMNVSFKNFFRHNIIIDARNELEVTASVKLYTRYHNIDMKWKKTVGFASAKKSQREKKSQRAFRFYLP